MKPWFEVWRVERKHEDSVDFWDYPTEQQAKEFSESEVNSTVRRLSPEEVLYSALSYYHSKVLGLM